MPVPVEKITPGQCFRASDNALRKVLLMQDKRVTYILRDTLSWTVYRYQANVESFAQECEAEIDCTTLEDRA
ncbi:hypothetical protein [Methylocapsa acidiphila]|uniref:hypothetical protein n=1 Tax=Methylocapsa acidiphila TaxID=133552 RepID=UPI000407E194|nr:hypothetical protein [Methylocapsa acidiphila]